MVKKKFFDKLQVWRNRVIPKSENPPGWGYIEKSEADVDELYLSQSITEAALELGFVGGRTSNSIEYVIYDKSTLLTVQRNWVKSDEIKNKSLVL